MTDKIRMEVVSAKIQFIEFAIGQFLRVEDMKPFSLIKFWPFSPGFLYTQISHKKRVLLGEFSWSTTYVVFFMNMEKNGHIMHVTFKIFVLFDHVGLSPMKDESYQTMLQCKFLIKGGE